MCLCVHDIWKTQFLLLILRILLNKSKNTILSMLIILAILWQVEITGKLFGVGTILCSVLSVSLLLLFWCVLSMKKCNTNTC